MQATKLEQQTNQLAQVLLQIVPVDGSSSPHITIVVVITL